MKMLYDEPRPLRELRPDIPAALHDLTHRAMAKLPQNRFAGMNEIELLLRRISSDLENAEAGSAVRSTAAAGGPPAAGSERTSIAVLPFRCLSADKEDTYMAEGITTEIISALSGVPGVRVAPHLASIRFRDSAQDINEAATTLNVRYIVTGSLRRSGPRTRVIAELSDVAEDHLIWSHTYDRAVEDVFAVQEHIARSVAGATGGQLLRVRSEQVSQAPVESLPAWELVRKAYHFWNYAFHIEGVNESLDLLRRAVQLDPGYAVAHGYLGFYLNQRLNAFISPDRKADRQECLAAAQRAFELAPGNPEVLEIVGMIWCCAAQADRAVTALRRAVQIAPFNLVAWGYLTLPLGWGGDQKEVAEAQQILDRLIADTPDHPSLPYWYYFKTGACFRQENFGVAAECAQKCFELQPRYLIARMAYSNALGALGHLDEARAAWSQVLAMNPYVTQEAYMEIITAVARTPERTEPHVRGFFAAGIFK
jgi:adenylate cyclase